ncbi:MAG: endolytic transglycosylase MltG [Deltaproteobacteria bacterium]|nr:endolytic transglycosylase MltG [Deltaproteobacteria bacterium]MBW2444329.1 endolytic transglycosylase MltG [Deltaproteobacteria bacterium]
MKPLKGLALAVLALGLLGGAALGAGGLWLRSNLAPAEAAAPDVDFEVARGASLKAVAGQLARRGVIRDARAFELLARWHELDGSLHVGEFVVSAAMPAGEILTILSEGRVKTYEVVIPEGFRATEIAARLAAAGLVDEAEFLAIVDQPGLASRLGVEGPGLEGYLFPETYRFPRGLSAEAVARVLVEHFLATWAEVEPEAKRQKLSMRAVVTLASIVEKETGAPAERPVIAAVFRNRLARRMRLASDPTTIYGISGFDGNLRRRDLEDDTNPYNTYKIPALPPGPIASPGADALRAVVAPAKTGYLFFVSRNDGTHVFARSYDEHERNVDRYQRKRRRK